MTAQLLRREPDLVGLYVAGGGVVGVLDALRETGRGRVIVTITNDITENTRRGLIDHDLSMVRARPISRLATEAIGRMLDDLRAGAGISNAILGFDIFSPENI